MMIHSTKVGVALLPFLGRSVSSAAEKDGGFGNVRKALRRGLRRRSKYRFLSKNNSVANRMKHDEDITEDVAFWTRMMQAGSLPGSPTPRPEIRPNPTPPPQAVTTPVPTLIPVSIDPTTPPVPIPSPTAFPTFTGTTDPPVPVPPPTLPPIPVPSPTDPPVATQPPFVVNAPVSRDDEASMLADEGLAFIDVLDNDTPALGEDLAIRAITSPASKGDCTISLDLLQVGYSPNGGFTGVDSCVYEACDSVPACDTATLTIAVN